MCINYRHLNKLFMKHLYPISHVYNLIDRLHGAQYIMKIYLQIGYHKKKQLLTWEIINNTFCSHGA